MGRTAWRCVLVSLAFARVGVSDMGLGTRVLFATVNFTLEYLPYVFRQLFMVRPPFPVSMRHSRWGGG